MKFGKLVASFVVGSALCVPAFAATIELGINGDAQIGSNYIDFGQYPTGAPYTPAPGYGTYEVSLVNAGVFSDAGITPGETGTIQSLDEGTGSVNLPGAFMTFDSNGSNITLVATNIPAGTSGPFTLTDTPDGAVASFNVDGNIMNGSTVLGTFSGTFSSTFDGQSVASLFSDLPLDTPFSATFTVQTSPPASVPLPTAASASLVGLGGLLLAKRLSSRKRATA